MKIVCECGNEVEFIPYEGEEACTDSDGVVYCDKSNYSFDFNACHDELYVGCKKCGKGIHI